MWPHTLCSAAVFGSRVGFPAGWPCRCSARARSGRVVGRGSRIAPLMVVPCSMPGDDTGCSAAPGDGAHEIATQVGCSECIAVDIVGARTVVTNNITHERVSLDGQWAIEHDDEGLFAQLYRLDCAPGGARAVDVDSLGWKKSVFRKQNEGLVVVQRSGADVSKIALEDIVTEQRQATITVTTAVSAASSEISAFVFCRHRFARQRCYWSLVDIYRFLSLSSFAGQPSKWIHNSLASWHKLFEGIVGDGSAFTVFSTYITDACEVRHSLPWASRCLPQTSIATAGLLALLVRWAFCPSQRGGGGGEAGQSRRCRCVARLLALLGLLCGLRLCPLCGRGDDRVALQVAPSGAIARWPLAFAASVFERIGVSGAIACPEEDWR